MSEQRWMLELLVNEKPLLNELTKLTSGLDKKKFKKEYPELFSIFKIISKKPREVLK